MDKDNDFDALGKRMKRYEEVMNSSKLIPDLPLYFRIDGRHFSKLTKNFGYPFKDLPAEKRSYVFTQLMQMTANGIMKEFKCDIIETHSDEINGGFRNIKTAPFDGKYFKLVSNIASYAGMSFMRHVATAYETIGHNECLSRKDKDDVESLFYSYPSFDCRLVQLPDLMELVNCFVWRQNDCIRGAINQYAQRWFTHKELLGKSQEDRIKMLSEKGHGVSSIEDFILYGSWYVKRHITESMDPKYAKFHAEGVTTMTRTKIVPLNLNNRLALIENKVEFLLDGEMANWKPDGNQKTGETKC